MSALQLLQKMAILGAVTAFASGCSSTGEADAGSGETAKTVVEQPAPESVATDDDSDSDATATSGTTDAVTTNETAVVTNDSYNVVRGDNLWKIAGKDAIYGNPFQWPLIYKANRSLIRDPDLIFPGQVFTIDRSMSSAAVDAAIRHAKTRGAWSLKRLENSDRIYLNQ